MSPLDSMSWWEFGLWCSLIAIFGSFIRTFCVDNITSVMDIFKQFFIAIFISSIICLYGNYKQIDKRVQLIFSAFSGMVGMKAIYYIVSKIGGLFGDVGKLLEGTTEMMRETKKSDLPPRQNHRGKEPKNKK